MNKKFVDPLEDNEPFEFPQALLNQVSECSAGGFILFFIDTSGTPQVRADFDHPIAEMGLRSYATKFLKGINSVEESDIAETLHNDEEESD